MVRGLFSISLTLLALSSRIEAVEPPFFEPKEGYYNARGTKVEVEWSVDRTEVPEDGAIVAQLVIRGAANPIEIIRPDLNKVRTQDGRSFAESFQIEDLPNTPGQGDSNVVIFTYRLRPRNRDVKRLSTLEFWYDSGRKSGNPFARTRASGIDIVVTLAAPRSKPAAIPLDAPRFLFEPPPAVGMLDDGPFQPSPAMWSGLLLVGPLVAGLWFAVWRWKYPGAAKLARIRRYRAFRRSIAAIRNSGPRNDPAASIAAAVIAYLRVRFYLPAGIETPAEVSRALENTTLDRGVVADVVEFLRDCDAARFAPAAEPGTTLASSAETLLFRLEGIA